MGRRKLTMELIEKEKARMITYQKRKRGLKKKAQEFSTLCGVPTCMIIYGPRLNNRPADVEVWPKDRKDFMAVVNLYRDKAFSSVRGVKSQNLFDFLGERKRKVEEKIIKIRKANYESKFSRDWTDDFNSFSIDQLKETLAVFDNSIEVATMKIQMLKGHQNCLIEESKPELFLNNAAQILFPKTMSAEVYNRQQNMFPYYNPCDNPHPNQPLQIVPYDFKPFDNPMMMMMMNGGDHQMGSSSYNIPLPLQHARYFDPMAAMIDNPMMNNPRAAMCLQPYEQFPVLQNVSSQIHGSGFDEFFRDMNEFRHKSER